MVGEGLRQLRKARNLSQQDLAEKAAVSQSYLSRLEKRILVNPSSEVVQRLADALGVPVAYLYSRPAEKNLVLRGELQARVEQAMDAAADDPDLAEELAGDSLNEVLGESPLDGEELSDLEVWGRRFVESRVALLRLAILEKGGDTGSSIPVEGRYRAGPDGEGEIVPGEDPAQILPRRLSALLIEKDDLVPGANRGDYVLYSPDIPTRDGGLAVLKFRDRWTIRRVYFGRKGELTIVSPGVASASDPPGRPETLESGDYEFAGGVAGVLYRREGSGEDREDAAGSGEGWTEAPPETSSRVSAPSPPSET